MKISGWGRYPKIESDYSFFSSKADVLRGISDLDNCIVHACGRSYGDSALNENIIFSKKYNCILEFDEKTGVVTCESGVSLAELIDVFLPRGWFLSITPGTKFVSVGGAIASDVHGKNHHEAGCFSASVLSFELLVPDGRIFICSENENTELFHATCGGMGLTGIILRVSMQLLKVNSAYVNQVTIKVGNLEELFDLFEEYIDWPYSVAWIDCLASGKRLGRSLVMIGKHANDGILKLSPSRKLNVAFEFPAITLNRYSVSIFNTLYYHKMLRKKMENKVSLEPFFYPLDSINNWNRIYGKNGFTQYQFVLPKENGFAGMTKILKQISLSGSGSFLAVLKLLGRENNNYLSFPREGYTLALDFKIEPKIFQLLDELDKIVLEYGGRLYLAKDVRMKQEMIECGYQKIREFRGVRKRYNLVNKFQSLQSNRLGL
jgi:decaprenylphospho-beta-D-ribofuranose 2-oxidase